MISLMDQRFGELISGEKPNPYGAESCGTTIIAVEFNGGIMIAADSRTSVGSFVSCRVTDKLTEITKHIYILRSGSAADTEAIADVVKYHLSVYEMEHGHPAPVYVGAQVCRDMCYRYRDDFSAGLIVAGWDKQEGGQVYSIPLGGMIVRQPIGAGGSGSTYIYGYLDYNYKEKMSEAECKDYLKKALALAMSRDGSSGGVIRLAVISDKGVERTLWTGDDIPKFSSN